MLRLPPRSTHLPHTKLYRFEMIDKKKEATFTGNVKVVQGDTTMKSKILVVFYENAGSTAPPVSPAPTASSAPAAPAKAPIKSATPGPGGSSSIRRLEAKGKV